MPFLLFLIILLVYNDPSFCRSVDDVPENRSVDVPTENPRTKTGTHGTKCTKCIVGAKRRHKSSTVFTLKNYCKVLSSGFVFIFCSTFELLWREYICSECARDNADKPFTCGRCKEGTSAQPFICRRCTNSNPDISSSSDYNDPAINSCNCPTGFGPQPSQPSLPELHSLTGEPVPQTKFQERKSQCTNMINSPFC